MYLRFESCTKDLITNKAEVPAVCFIHKDGSAIREEPADELGLILDNTPVPVFTLAEFFLCTLPDPGEHSYDSGNDREENDPYNCLLEENRIGCKRGKEGEIGKSKKTGEKQTTPPIVDTGDDDRDIIEILDDNEDAECKSEIADECAEE
jgi:hypothetical protein